MALIKASPPAVAGLAGLVTGHAVMVAVMSLTPVHLHAGGAGLTVIGLTISLHIAGMYGFSPVAGWLADTSGRRTGLVDGLRLARDGDPATAGAGHSAGHGHPRARSCSASAGRFTTIAGSAQIADAVARPDRPRVQGTADLCMSLVRCGGRRAGGRDRVHRPLHGLSLVATLAVFPAAAILARARAEAAPA